jgi:hypothetical protein
MKKILLIILIINLIAISNSKNPNVASVEANTQISKAIETFVPYKFIKITDTQQSSTDDNSGPEALYSLLATTVQEQEIEFILHSGDVVEFGSEQDDYDTYYWPYMSSVNESVPIFYAAGNHDYKGYGSENDEKDLNTWRANTNNPGNGIYYSFNTPQNDTHFIVLNSEYYFEDQNTTRQEAQLNWLTSDLSSNTLERIVVMFHRGMYGANPGYAWAHPTIRNVWEDLFIEYGVDAVLVGHDHCFYHGNRYGIDHITSGVGATTLIRPIPWHPSLDWQENDKFGEGNHISIFEATETGFNVDLLYTNGTTFNFSIIVPIVDNFAPRLIKTNNTVAYQETDGYNVSWIFDDDHPDNYTLYLDNTSVQNGNWMSSVPISYNLDDLTAGTYEFSVTVDDKKGYSFSVNTSVEILPGTAPTTTTTTTTISTTTTITTSGTPGFQFVLIISSLIITIKRRKK